MKVLGVEVRPNVLLPDGQTLLVEAPSHLASRGHTYPSLSAAYAAVSPDRAILVGVEPRSDPAEAAVRIVRAGLADVLRWLGQPVMTGHQVIAAFAMLADPEDAET